MKIRAGRGDIDQLTTWVAGENVETKISGPNEAGIYHLTIEAPSSRWTTSTRPSRPGT
jgi:hypothetical protein